jgi:phage terminase large subunit-like protein
MRDETPENVPEGEGPDFSDYRHWKPEYQQRALEMLREQQESEWRPFYCPNATCDGTPHDTWEWRHARADQRPPKWNENWLTLFFSGGRGSGKTRSGSEITHRVTDITPRIILIAPTGPDLRETMVEGVSGILACSPPGKRPHWEPSRKRLTWPNGCIAQGFSAEEPDRLRGPQSGFVWADEPAHYPDVEQVWDNMLFGLRVKSPKGFPPKVIATSTPKPTKWTKALIADPKTITRRVSTYANLDNLDDTFRQAVLDKYEGTRIGRQELHGEILDDVEGALWDWSMIRWVEDAPIHLTRIVVAVDPAGTANRRSDETGIVVVGIGSDKDLYVLADYTGRYTPAGWGEKVWQAYQDHRADAVVAERTYGQDMVTYVLESTKRDLGRVITVDSRRGKALRAEPIVALYEQGRVHHVGKQGVLAELEEEMTSWVPGEGASPNRVDALVHGATHLGRIVAPATIADPNKILHLRAPSNTHLRAV